MANTQTTVPLFVANQVLTAAQQNLSAGTGVPVFATTVTRDAAFGGANKALAEGQLAYIEASNVVQYYDGAAWATVGPSTAGGLVFIKSQTIGTAVSSVNVTSAFSATYDRYLITLGSGGASTTNRNLNLTLGATVTGYYDAGLYVTYSSTTVNGESNSNGSSFTSVAYASTQGVVGRFEVNNPFNALRTDVISQFGASLATAEFNVAGGFLDNATSYTDFTLTMASTGTITGGAIYVYGYAKA